MKTIFIIGDDKVGRQAAAELNVPDAIWLNRSVGSKRVWRLIRSGAIKLPDVLAIALADIRRPNLAAPVLPIIQSNADVLELIKAEVPDRIICYRAGLVLTRRVLDQPVQFLNVHCADLPKYGGLGTLHRALRDKAFAQNACLHEITTVIDGGRVLHKEPYHLSPTRSFRLNEDVAYAAGRKILNDIASGHITP
ncbi:MAG: formyltransferase family protein [Planktotalea sp.]|uniref:formyltransferase family protein n=1 Tax=Planktotalea sp. TaxID=2029877 RepID=UPI003C709512